MFYAVVDCDNCYVSCERVFNPELKDKPVVVLSNNDGCVVSRSNEAKALGVKAGMPYYQMRQQFADYPISVFSSNYELYGELTSRIVSIIQQESPAFYRYSIDECFVMLRDANSIELQQWGSKLYNRIYRSVGMPVSIGISFNKSLAKIASHFAKQFSGYQHCCIIDSEEKRLKALCHFPISDVWGIGRRTRGAFESRGLRTALDFASCSEGWVQKTFNNINILRIWSELNGKDCIPNEIDNFKKSITSSRSFNGMVSDLELLRTYAANHACNCTEKLRAQKCVASVVYVSLCTNLHRDDLPQDITLQSCHMFTPTSSTINIMNAVLELVNEIYKPGYLYKKIGVTLSGISSDTVFQTNFLDYDAFRFEKLRRIDSALDELNGEFGLDCVSYGVQHSTSVGSAPQGRKFDYASLHEHRSKNPTTRWNDIILLK